MKQLRTLLFSSLYPSSVRPGHGIFVETRLRELLGSGQVETHVVAPVPWFPFKHERYGDYARMARTPQREKHNGIDVQHPRYVLPPKVGMTMAPLSMALASRGAVQRLLDEGFDFDVIDAHYFYPDGVAAALLSRWFNKPFTVTARGTDLNLIPRFKLPRRMMQWAAARAAACIGVCAALIDVLRDWQVDAAKLHVMRNGVDLQRFRPIDPAAARERLNVGGAPMLLSVGYLVERKGHHVAIDALARLLPAHPGARLYIVGEGEEKARLIEQTRQLGVEASVTFVGAVPNVELLQWYSAADIFLLASSREGWANVLLEAMACGTPVVATRIWGTPEVVTAASGGRLVDERSGAAFAEAIGALLHSPADRGSVRRYAEDFSWASTTQAQLTLFGRLASRSDAHA